MINIHWTRRVCQSWSDAVRFQVTNHKVNHQRLNWFAFNWTVGQSHLVLSLALGQDTHITAASEVYWTALFRLVLNSSLRPFKVLITINRALHCTKRFGCVTAQNEFRILLCGFSSRLISCFRLRNRLVLTLTDFYSSMIFLWFVFLFTIFVFSFQFF